MNGLHRALFVALVCHHQALEAPVIAKNLGQKIIALLSVFAVKLVVRTHDSPRLGAQIHYANWRDGKKEGEVDIVGLNIARQKPVWAVEVKWTDRFYEHPTELQSLKYFMDKNDMNYAIVTTRSQFGTKEIGKCKLQFIPTACYAYTVAENTLKQTKSSYGL